MKRIARMAAGMMIVSSLGASALSNSDALLRESNKRIFRLEKRMFSLARKYVKKDQAHRIKRGVKQFIALGWFVIGMPTCTYLPPVFYGPILVLSLIGSAYLLSNALTDSEEVRLLLAEATKLEQDLVEAKAGRDLLLNNAN